MPLGTDPDKLVSLNVACSRDLQFETDSGMVPVSKGLECNNTASILDHAGPIEAGIVPCNKFKLQSNPSDKEVQAAIASGREPVKELL